MEYVLNRFFLTIGLSIFENEVVCIKKLVQGKITYNQCAILCPIFTNNSIFRRWRDPQSERINNFFGILRV